MRLWQCSSSYLNLQGGTRRRKSADSSEKDPRPRRSKALPDFVWLTGMDENRGVLRFQGQSNSLAAVADFISGLQRSGWFPQVDLGSSQENLNIVNFTVTGTFKDPEVAAKEKAVSDAKAAADAAAAPAGKSPRGKK